MLPPDLDFLCATSTTNQLIDWARQAGQIALKYFKSSPYSNRPDRQWLAEADREIEEYLIEQICTTYPEHGLISEEGRRNGARFRPDTFWVIDPLDGTTAFAQGLPGWGISIGLLHRGEPCFGLFYMPLLDDLTYTVGPEGVYDGEGRDLSRMIRPDWGQKGFLAITASAHSSFQINVRRTRALGSVGASLVYTARGAAVAALLPKPRLCDLVAGAAIVTQAGGEVRYLSGRRIDYRQLLNGRPSPEPMIAGNPCLLAELQQAIRMKQAA